MVAYLTETGQTGKKALLMRWSGLFIPTLRQAPSEAETTHHKLLARAGLLRDLGSGSYTYLPLARRSLIKIEKILREELIQIGAQEFHSPSANLSAHWKQTAMTIARNELRSYRDLPQIWFLPEVRLREESHPSLGIPGATASSTIASLSIALDEKESENSLSIQTQACRSLLQRCGINPLVVESTPESRDGKRSRKYVSLCLRGKDPVVHCTRCHYSAILESATALIEKVVDVEEIRSPTEVHTPDQKTIQQISSFLDVPESRLIKSLVYMAGERLHLLLLRGDHQLSEAKLSRFLGAEPVSPASAEEVRELLQTDPGSLGPVGLQGTPVLVDLALKDRRNMICGANKNDFHLLDVTPGVDFPAEYTDLRKVQEGDLCPLCEAPLKLVNATAIAESEHVQMTGATILTQDGQPQHPWMGSCRIEVERILATVAENCNDDLGLVWPRSIAPFQVIITLLRPDDPDQFAFAEDCARKLDEHLIDCLLDDRDERPGVKFKDAELIGFPVRVTLGRKFAEGQVELFNRAEQQTMTAGLDETIERVLGVLAAYSH